MGGGGVVSFPGVQGNPKRKAQFFEGRGVPLILTLTWQHGRGQGSPNSTTKNGDAQAISGRVKARSSLLWVVKRKVCNTVQ